MSYLIDFAIMTVIWPFLNMYLVFGQCSYEEWIPSQNVQPTRFCKYNLHRLCQPTDIVRTVKAVHFARTDQTYTMYLDLQEYV